MSAVLGGVPARKATGAAGRGGVNKGPNTEVGVLLYLRYWRLTFLQKPVYSPYRDVANRLSAEITSRLVNQLMTGLQDIIHDTIEDLLHSVLDRVIPEFIENLHSSDFEPAVHKTIQEVLEINLADMLSKTGGPSNTGHPDRYTKGAVSYGMWDGVEAVKRTGESTPQDTPQDSATPRLGRKSKKVNDCTVNTDFSRPGNAGVIINDYSPTDDADPTNPDPTELAEGFTECMRSATTNRSGDVIRYTPSNEYGAGAESDRYLPNYYVGQLRQDPAIGPSGKPDDIPVKYDVVVTVGEADDRGYVHNRRYMRYWLDACRNRQAADLIETYTAENNTDAIARLRLTPHLLKASGGDEYGKWYPVEFECIDFSASIRDRVKDLGGDSTKREKYERAIRGITKNLD